MSLAHEHHCQPGFIDLLDSVKDFLTREDMSRFKKMCKKGVHVDGGEYFLYEQYISYVVEGETQSVGPMSRMKRMRLPDGGSLTLIMWPSIIIFCGIRCPRMLLICNFARLRRKNISTSSW